MDTTNTKPRNNWLKNWWRDWAKIDLTVLPIGIALAYFLNNLANGFWFNLSTELIGAYISVRFIDFLLRRTENRHHQRRELAGNLTWFYENADRLIPDFYDWRIKDLANEIKYFDERWDERKRLLEIDEKILVEGIRESRQKIVHLAESYVNSYRIVDQAEETMYDKVSDIPEWWRDLRYGFREYRKTIINAQEIIVPRLEKAFSELTKPSALTVAEIDMLQEYTDKVRELKNIRDAVEEEVRKHEKLTYNLRNNIFQESG